MTSNVNAPVAVLVAESVTITVRFALPDAVGVPENTPLDESEIPAGNVPELTAKVYGGVPPEATSLALYAVPTVPDGILEVVKTSGAGLIKSVSAAFAVFAAESVTVSVKLALTAAVGVPENTPADDSDIPAGNVPVLTAKVYGAVPPVAASDAEYATPTVPAGRLEVISTKGAGFTVSVKLADPLAFSESVAVMVSVELPAAVGVPENIPIEESEIPLGNVPNVTAKVYGPVPPLAATEEE